MRACSAVANIKFLDYYKMRFVFIVRDLTVEGGGPPRSVCGLASALADRGNTVSICAGTFETEFPELRPTNQGVGIFKIKSLSHPLSLRQALKTIHIDSDTFVHANMVWALAQFGLAPFIKRRGGHLITCPRGNLTKWSFNSKSWKKKPFWNLITKRFYNASDCVHATSEEELNDLRWLGIITPIVNIRNATDVPEVSKTATHNSPKGEKRILFLSRISKKKGLELLLDAWDKIRKNERADWKLVIAGTDSENYLSVLKDKVKQLALEDSVEFIGGVAGKKREEAYASADLFVLPTFTENYGLVIAEALARGVPVITTKGAPWEDIEKSKCGWWCDISVDSVAKALKEGMRLTNQERKEMGLRGRELIIQKHSWNTAAEKIEKVCSWIKGGHGISSSFIAPDYVSFFNKGK